MDDQGGLGDYFDVAHTVIMMDSYRPRDVTMEAKAISTQFQNASSSSTTTLNRSNVFGPQSHRFPRGASLVPNGKVFARGKERIQYGEAEIDVSSVEQLVEPGQARAIGAALKRIGQMAGGSSTKTEE